jgi:hypothetical protein
LLKKEPAYLDGIPYELDKAVKTAPQEKSIGPSMDDIHAFEGLDHAVMGY